MKLGRSKREISKEAVIMAMAPQSVELAISWALRTTTGKSDPLYLVALFHSLWIRFLSRGTADIGAG